MTGGVVIDLLRHGETGRSGFRGNLDDPLAPAGWEQMQRATHEAKTRWQVVVSSPLARCADFAHAFAAERGLPLEWDARLAELHFGDWEGQDAEILHREQPQALGRFWTDPWSYTPPGGESLTAFETRVRAAWVDISKRHTSRHVLVVTHGGVIRLLLCVAGGWRVANC